MNHIQLIKKHREKVAVRKSLQFKDVQRPKGFIQTAQEELADDAFSLDLKALKSLATIEEKVAFKRDKLIPKYMPEAVAYIKEERTDPFVLLPYMMVWCFDAEMIEEALGFADACITTKQNMPFNTSPEAFAVEQLMDWARAQLDEGNNPEPYFSSTLDMVRSGNWVINEKKAALYYREVINMLKEGEEDERRKAYELCLEAIEKFGKSVARVKTTCETLAKEFGDDENQNE